MELGFDADGSWNGSAVRYRRVGILVGGSVGGVRKVGCPGQVLQGGDATLELSTGKAGTRLHMGKCQGYLLM